MGLTCKIIIDENGLIQSFTSHNVSHYPWKDLHKKVISKQGEQIDSITLYFRDHVQPIRLDRTFKDFEQMAEKILKHIET